MNKEIKRQIVLIFILICLFIGTLVVWYPNFMFHTYIKQVDYQFCLSGSNDDIMISGFEMYQNSQNAYHGNARLLSTQNNLFLKGDNIHCVVTIQDMNEQTYQYQYDHNVKTTNELIYLDKKEDTKKAIDFDIQKANIEIIIQRNNKEVYKDLISLEKQDYVIYNGGNKDYTIQDVYVSGSWLKTGYFSTTNENLTKEYSHYVIDYMLLDDVKDLNDINDAERIVHLSGTTEDLIQNEIQEVYFHDEDTSLEQKNIVCVVTLLKDNQEKKPLVFMVELHGTIKAGVQNVTK